MEKLISSFSKQTLNTVFFIVLFVILVLLTSITLHATENYCAKNNCTESNYSENHNDERILPLERPSKAPVTLPADSFQRIKFVLNHYKVPSENDPTPELQDLNEAQSYLNLKKIIKYFDPLKIFSHFLSYNENEFIGFQDYDSKKVQDFYLRLKKPSTNLRPIRTSLNGLRVAIDPGHMGSPFWDKATGKFVKDATGKILSEGVLALQTALILKNELESLGAIVMLTHSGLHPVSSENFEKFDILPVAKKEFIDQSAAPWFLNLIAQNPIGPDLIKSFEISPQRKKNIFK